MIKYFQFIIFLFLFTWNFFCPAQGYLLNYNHYSEITPSDIFRIHTLNSLAFINKENNPVLALEFANESRALASEFNYEPGIAEANILLSTINLNLGNYNESLYSSELAFQYFNATHVGESFWDRQINLKQAALALNQMGNIHGQLNNYSEASKRLNESLKISKEINDLKGIADSYNGIGLLYRLQGEISESMKNHLDALKIQEETNDTMGLAATFQYIGILYIFQGHYVDAMEYLQKAYKIHQNKNNKRGIAEAEGNIGWWYGDQELLDSSLAYTKLAVEKFREIGDKANMSMYFNNLGFLDKHLGNYEAAMKNLMIAADLSKATGNLTTLAEIYESIGETYYLINNYDSSLSWLNRSLAMAKQIKANRIIKECYLAMAKVYVKMNNYQKAYYYRTLLSDIKEITDGESNRKIADMKSKFETDKLDKEIQLLNKDKELLKQSEDLQSAEIANQIVIKRAMIVGFVLILAIAFLIVRAYSNSRKVNFEKQVSEVEMKVLRSQMNPHFIFNSLHSINDYIRHNKTILASEYLVNFSKLMRMILENSRHKDIVLSQEINTLNLYMALESQRMTHPFKCNFEIDPSIDPENTLIPPMLLQPIIENSIWHGLAPKSTPGEINIRFRKLNNEIHCEVEDNGVGRKQIKTSINHNSTESFALKILAERLAIIDQVKKMNTSLAFHDLNEPDTTGLIVSFRIPFEEYL